MSKHSKKSLDAILGGASPVDDTLPGDELNNDPDELELDDDELALDDDEDVDVNDPDYVAPDDDEIDDDLEDEEDDDPAPPADDEVVDTDWEKRFKDTEKAFQAERRKSSELEGRIAALEAGSPATAEEDDDFDFEEEYAEDPAKALKEMNRRQTAAIQRAADEAARKTAENLESAQRDDSLAAQEAQARKDHSDYDQLVNDEFIQRVQKSEELQAAWQNSGGTAEAAYKLAKRDAEYQEYLKTGKAPKSNSVDEEAGKPKRQRRSLRGTPRAGKAPKRQERRVVTHGSVLSGLIDG